MTPALSANQFHSPREARSCRNPPVTGEQGRVEGFGEGNVDGVVGRQVFTQRPDAIEKRFVAVTLQIEVSKIVEQLCSTPGVDLSAAHESPRDLCNLEIREMRDVKAHFGVIEPIGNRVPQLGREQELDQRRGVDDDQRESRSALTKSAAD